MVMAGDADGCGGGGRDKMKSRSESLFISFTALHHDDVGKGGKVEAKAKKICFITKFIAEKSSIK